MKIALFDGMNLIHRSRNSFSKGDHALTYSFFRSFKPLIEKINPDVGYFVLEGKPKHRNQEYEGYKANRPKQPDSFWRQQQEILNIMQSLPVSQARHPDFECDDVIANMAKSNAEIGNDVVIVSGDSDFIQIFDHVSSERVSIYHPIKKAFIEKPVYNYLDWKSLRGDASDNIPGIKGVGDKTATKIVNDPDFFREILSNPEKRAIYERNKRLIEFVWFDDSLVSQVEFRHPRLSIAEVKRCFAEMKFESMVSDKYWNKFENAFSKMSVANEDM